MTLAHQISYATSVGGGDEFITTGQLDEAARAMFVDLIPTRIVDIEALVQVSKSQDCADALEKVGQIAHKLAGTAKTIGLHEIDRLSRVTENGILNFLQSSRPTTDLPVELDQNIELLLDELEEAYFT